MAAGLINIPEEALPDFQKIVDLSPGEFESLFAAIKETKPTLRPFQFREAIAQKVKTVSAEDIRSILGIAFVLYSIKQKNNISSQELVEAVINSDLLSQDKDLGLRKDDLRDRVQLLLNLDDILGVTAKALDVMTEHERIFCKARILSDIRPIFSKKSDQASAAVIIHNLQVGFHMGGEHQEFYVALDTDDLKQLKEAIERAEEKTVALEAVLQKSDIMYLKV